MIFQDLTPEETPEENPRPNHTIYEKINNFFRDKPEVIAVYLFGSYAEDRARNFSDVDIGILIDGTSEEFLTEKRNTYMTKLGRILRKDIHPVILNVAGEELMRQIFLKGKCVLVNDAEKLACFKMVAYMKMAEFNHYRNQMQRGFIKKVMEG